MLDCLKRNNWAAVRLTSTRTQTIWLSCNQLKKAKLHIANEPPQLCTSMRGLKRWQINWKSRFSSWQEKTSLRCTRKALKASHCKTRQTQECCSTRATCRWGTRAHAHQFTRPRAEGFQQFQPRCLPSSLHPKNCACRRHQSSNQWALWGTRPWKDSPMRALQQRGSPPKSAPSKRITTLWADWPMISLKRRLRIAIAKN